MLATFGADRASAVRNETDLTPDPDLGEYVIDAAVLNGALWLVGENAGMSRLICDWPAKQATNRLHDRRRTFGRIHLPPRGGST
jgi:hypothetical protein